VLVTEIVGTKLVRPGVRGISQPQRKNTKSWTYYCDSRIAIGERELRNRGLLGHSNINYRSNAAEILAKLK